MALTPEQIADQRDKAGLRYAKAVAELREAIIDLAVWDRLAPKPSGPGAGLPYTFSAWTPECFPDLKHRTYCPNPPHRLAEAIKARLEELKTR